MVAHDPMIRCPFHAMALNDLGSDDTALRRRAARQAKCSWRQFFIPTTDA
jgi:hypothetical protein